MRIGIMGGTFNPIHNGHLIVAENARIQYRLDKVTFMPAGIPPHKKDAGILPGSVRAQMVKLAIEGNTGFQLSTYELENDCISYSYQTLEYLKEIHPENQLYFILGADSLRDITGWKQPKKIFSCCTILAAVRDEYEAESLKAIAQQLSRDFQADIQTIKTPLFQVSSNEIRNRVQTGDGIRYLVPHNVAVYIEENNLYRQEYP